MTTTPTKPKAVAKPKTPAKPKTAAKPRAQAKYAAQADTLTAKAKTAYAKGGEVVAEVGAFTKANALALGAAGKIFGTGMKKIGAEVLDEGKVAVAMVKDDFEQLRAIRTPVELVKFQTGLIGRKLGAMTAFGVKHTDEVVKLVEASIVPIAHRVDVAVNTVKSFKKAA